MEYKEYREFVKESYESYKKIEYVECPAFNCEKVFFLKRGFRHLIWKGTKLRSIEEQMERLSLLKYADVIIKTSQNFKDFNKNKILYKSNSKIDFWSFNKVLNNDEIIVVVRQIQGNPKHFFSIMKRDKKHKTP